VLFIWSFTITLWWREIQFLIFSIAADVCLDPDRQGSKQISEYLGDILCFSLIMSIVCDVYYYGTMAKKSFIMQTTLTTSWREKIFFFLMLGKRQATDRLLSINGNIQYISLVMGRLHSRRHIYENTRRDEEFSYKRGRDFCVEFCRCIKMRHLAPWIACYFHGFVTDCSIHAQAISAYWLSYVNAHNKRLHTFPPQLCH
jgi:hypothetical protein